MTTEATVLLRSAHQKYFVSWELIKYQTFCLKDYINDDDFFKQKSTR